MCYRKLLTENRQCTENQSYSSKIDGVLKNVKINIAEHHAEHREPRGKGNFTFCFHQFLRFPLRFMEENVFWKTWPNVSTSTNIPSSFWSYLINEQVNVASLLSLKLFYVGIAGTFILVAGLFTLVLSRQIFYSSGESVSLKCPYCKNSWKARRAVGWAECPYCRKFIQPQVARPTA